MYSILEPPGTEYAMPSASTNAIRRPAARESIDTVSGTVYGGSTEFDGVQGYVLANGTVTQSARGARADGRRNGPLTAKERDCGGYRQPGRRASGRVNGCFAVVLTFGEHQQ